MLLVLVLLRRRLPHRHRFPMLSSIVLLLGHSREEFLHLIYFSPRFFFLFLFIPRQINEVRLHSSVERKSIETVSMRSMMMTMIDTFQMSSLRTN